MSVCGVEEWWFVLGMIGLVLSALVGYFFAYAPELAFVGGRTTSDSVRRLKEVLEVRFDVRCSTKGGTALRARLSVPMSETALTHYYSRVVVFEVSPAGIRLKARLAILGGPTYATRAQLEECMRLVVDSSGPGPAS